MHDHEMLHIRARHRRTAGGRGFHELNRLCRFGGDVVTARREWFQGIRQRLPSGAMRHFQRLKNVVLNICVERFSGHTLQNIAGKRRSVIGIGWRRTGGKDSDRQMFLKIFIERRKVGSRRNKEWIDHSNARTLRV